MSAYCNPMSIRNLFAILVAVAVVFAPAFMSVGMAQAAVPDHHAQMTEKGHCDPANDEDQNKPAGTMACCGAMCMAVAVTASTMALAEPLLGSLPVARLHAFRTGVPAELATPPPRAA
jgi:hypothetical protein